MYNKFTEYNGGASPFNRFFCLNIFAKTIHNPSSKFNGYVDLYANSAHNESIIKLIATSDNESLINLASNAILETKVNRETLVNTMDFYGSFTLNALSLQLNYITTINIGTENVVLPISWYFNVNMHEFKDGNASTVDLTKQGIKLLPGAKMIIDSGVTVDAKYITIYESFPTSKENNSDRVGYTVNGEWIAYEKAHNVPAQFVLNGKLSIATIGGKVMVEEDGAILSVTGSTLAIVREIDSVSDGFLSDNPSFKSSKISLTLPTLSEGKVVYTESAVGEYVSSNGAFALKTN